MMPLPGSSPRVRGKPAPFAPSVASTRIIPARAGQTVSHRRRSRATPDHPRACGANQCLEQFGLVRFGSSPRVRGKLWPLRPCHPWPRIIPARAGQTGRRWLKRQRGPDHPRACGANTDVEQHRKETFGSSPRVRGKRPAARPTRPPTRIIPARAGQTLSLPLYTDNTPDHPRACGANDRWQDRAKVLFGSSPRVRGKLRCLRCRSPRFRIIPARAGQTGRSRASRSAAPDHPRACGANDHASALAAVHAGSSPRVRGKQGMGWRFRAA